MDSPAHYAPVKVIYHLLSYKVWYVLWDVKFHNVMVQGHLLFDQVV